MTLQPTPSFDAAYSILNAKQKKAVEHVYGPLMVIAGPGTGKTQILAGRIGYILLHTDTQPNNILCLTYTDAGVVAMRNRLIQFIGPAAYNVQIHTFHSFCNKVIQENPEFFQSYGELLPADDLDKAEIFEKLFESLDISNPLKGKMGVNDYDRGCLVNFFEYIRKENVDLEQLDQDLKHHWEELPSLEEYQYQRKYGESQKGDPKTKQILIMRKKLEKTIAGIEAFRSFQKLMTESSLYDFTDMILWVIEAFNKHPELLERYREQFLFILADEYQDTNGSQNRILFQLSGEPEERPNVMVVGDDDQAIYRFQGANLENILEYNKRFEKDIELVLLEENYRSSQLIIDASLSMIKHNQERLENQIGTLEKHFEAKGATAADRIPPIFRYYNDPISEVIGTVNEIEKALERGILPKEIAVLYRKHRHADLLIEILRERKIAFQLRKKENALEVEPVKQLILILECIETERKDPFSGNHFLFEILHFPFFDFNTVDIARYARAMKERDGVKSWREPFSDESFLSSIGIKNTLKWIQFGELFESWIAASFNTTPQILLERIVFESGMLKSIIESSEKQIFLSALNAFDRLVKERAARTTNQKLEHIILLLKRMEKFNIRMDVTSILPNNEGVQLLSAHGSKGLEFECVFILGAIDKNWESQRSQNRNFVLPPEHQFSNLDASGEEDERRLFYVAMTRAKSQLSISASRKTTTGKEVHPSRFVVEALDPNLNESYVEIPKEELLWTHSLNYRPLLKQAELIEEQWLDEILENFVMSPTSLNKYLRCPLSFYFENILRIPSARNANMGFGSAIHYALEKYFQIVEKNGQFGTAAELLDWFEKGMEKYHSHFTQQEYQERMDYGRSILPLYLEHHLPQWEQYKILKSEYPVQNAHLEGVPITGKFDRIDKRSGEIHVLDYKTGNPGRAKQRLKSPEATQEEIDAFLVEQDPEVKEKLRLKVQGQDYWRQLVFYKILLDADPSSNLHTHRGVVSFIEPNKEDKFEEKNLVINPVDEEIVRLQIIEADKNIRNRKFSKGCGREQCKWCSFASNYYEQEI